MPELFASYIKCALFSRKPRAGVRIQVKHAMRAFVDQLHPKTLEKYFSKVFGYTNIINISTQISFWLANTFVEQVKAWLVIIPINYCKFTNVCAS